MGIKAKWLKDIPIPFPKSLAAQATLANELDDLTSSIERLQNIYSRKLLDLVELRQSILQKAFAGELTKRMDLAA